jgi:hypothetical protein
MDWANLPYPHPRQLPTEDEIRHTKLVMEQLDRSIEDLQRKKANYASYVAPFRRLPTEILREIINICIDDGVDITVMAGICSRIRDVALGMTGIWSDIKLRSIDSRVMRRFSDAFSREVSY